MLLAIDIGNTNAVFAVFKGERLIDSWRLQSLNGRSADEYAVFLQNALAFRGVEFSDIDDVIIGSVVPEARFPIMQLCTGYLSCEPVFVSKDSVPLEIDLKTPDEVGADRLVNAVAVKVFHSYPAIVIDFGTATTFDVIDAKGRYAGGVIAPGIDLSMNALHRAASKLPKISVQQPNQVIGKSTREAMQSGIYFGYKGLIDGLVAGIKSELGSDDVLILATGGLADLFAKNNDLIDVVDGDLTLKGLQQIYKESKR